MTREIRTVQWDWPGDFRVGQAVVHEGRFAHVVAVPPGVVPESEVPIMYDDEENNFITTYPENLTLRFQSAPISSRPCS